MKAQTTGCQIKLRVMKTAIGGVQISYKGGTECKWKYIKKTGLGKGYITDVWSSNAKV